MIETVVNPKAKANSLPFSRGHEINTRTSGIKYVKVLIYFFDILNPNIS